MRTGLTQCSAVRDLGVTILLSQQISPQLPPKASGADIEREAVVVPHGAVTQSPAARLRPDFRQHMPAGSARPVLVLR